MIGPFVRIYKIGRELGLNKKEIKRLWFFNNPKHATLSILKMIIIIITFSVISIMIFYILINRNTYPAGTKYSTVKIEDFQLKNDKYLKIDRKLNNKIR